MEELKQTIKFLDSIQIDKYIIGYMDIHDIMDRIEDDYGAFLEDHPIFENFQLSLDQRPTAIIGQNGAGKTTTLHTITGLKGATDGVIEYDGKDLRRMDPSHIIRIGMAHVPEGRHVFTQMSVQENLEMGSDIMNDKSQIKKNSIEV